MTMRYAKYPHWAGLEKETGNSQTIEQAIAAGAGAATLPGATAFIVAANAGEAVKEAAESAKAHYGNLIQVCDGVDDHAEIHAARDALPNGVGVIQLSSGDLLGDELALKDYQCLRGMGMGQTTYKLKPHSSPDVAYIVKNYDPVNGNSYVAIEDLMLDGNKANQYFGHGIHILGTGDACWYTCISRVYVKDAKNAAIKLIRNMALLVSDCVVVNPGTHGIDFYASLQNQCRQARVRDNYVSGCPGAGITPGICYGAAVSGNQLYNNLNGIALDGARDAVIGGNFIEGSAECGIWLTTFPAAFYATYNTIVWNMIRGCAKHGIGDSSGALAGHNVIGLNTIHSCGDADNDFAGIFSNGIATAIALNTIGGCGRYGIYLPSGVRQKVLGNTVERSKRHGIYVLVGDCLINDNESWDNGQDATDTYSGIHATGEDLILMGNRCSDGQTPKTQKYGIVCGSGSHYRIVALNNLRGNLTGGLSSDAGDTGEIEEHNQV